MRSLSDLTSRVCLACALAGGTLVIVGCGTHSPSPAAARPSVQGYVNLNALVQHHPGWSGVARFDEALRRLKVAEAQLPPVQSGAARATVPALPQSLDNHSPAIPPALLASEDIRMAQSEAAHLAGLRQRRARARRYQLRRQAGIWESDAERLYPMPGSDPAIQPDLALQLLRVDVAQLTRTVNGWSLSKPPTPELTATRVRLAQAQAELALLEAQRAQEEISARERFAAAVARVQAARAIAVAALSLQQEIALRADDERHLAAQGARLSSQREALLADAAQQTSAQVPAAGSLAAQALPAGPEVARAALSQESLRASAARLRAQRARWITFLYADARAAALDAAQQRGWTVSFAPTRAGEADLTAPLAQALESGAWRT